MQTSVTTITVSVYGKPIAQAYASPQLINYGSINVLTAGGSGAKTEPMTSMGCSNGRTLQRC